MANGITAQKIDQVNILLVVISLAVAIWLPFELFLFSYAFLGPLHYLTEINWLNEKNYFTDNGKHWLWYFVAIGIAISIFPVAQYLNSEFKLTLPDIANWFNTYRNYFFIWSFLVAISLVLLKTLKQKLIGVVLAGLVVYFFGEYNNETLNFIGLFLPTLIHVYLFTILFVLYGALKSNSKPGKLLSLVLLAVPFIIMKVDIDPTKYILSKEVDATFRSSNFGSIISEVGKLIGLKPGTKEGFTMAVKIQMFVTFAYTYHYLNWFSKTSVIGWQKSLTAKSTILVAVLWIISVGVYVYDYRMGFIALFFLSFLHVLLEFPLNIVSIKGILLHKSK